MQKKSSRFGLFIKKHKTISILLGIIIVILLWWSAVNLTPKPLGDKLEYIGKRDYGCWTGFCDSNPGTSYFYATDMVPQEIADYFKDASIINGKDLKPTANSSQQEGDYDITLSHLKKRTGRSF